uniref:Cadherin domain-containing protein n=1 Tax=Electrophorus electricus TaxID=8005 RepID=A0A4W4F8H7_ELEEL
MEFKRISASDFSLSFCLVLVVAQSAIGDVSYSFPEEMKGGSVIGNLAKDLGLSLSSLSARKARVDTEGNQKRYCDINLNTGELTITERIDREGLCGKKASCVITQELVLESPLELHRISLHVQDINDNAPKFKKDLIKLEIRESAVKGARYLLDEALDGDIEGNTVQNYVLENNDHFSLSVHTNMVGGKYGELVLEKELDREKQQEVSLILTAVDGGTPPRSGTVTIYVTVLDANDNTPVFSQTVYTVTATDPDWRQNGTVVYSLFPSDVNGAPVTSFLSINGDTGVIHAVRSFDYEQFKSFKVLVLARDNGSPPLRSNVTVSVFIMDENDNSPQILYPSPDGNSFMTEMVPKTVHVGSLVSKVIAVDADSGQNAWLSYHIVKATDQGLFTINIHSGEIRMQRDISESDNMKQNLIVSVRDNGQPSLSATCIMYLIISDNLAEVPELKDMSHDESNTRLTFYLVVALVSVSTFFLVFIIIIMAVRFCRKRKPRLMFDGAVTIPSAYLPPNYADVEGTGTLHSNFNYDAYLTAGSRTSDFKFVTSYNEETLPADVTMNKSQTPISDFVGLRNATNDVQVWFFIFTSNIFHI